MHDIRQDVGRLKEREAFGFLAKIGVLRVYSPKKVDIDGVLSYLSGTESQKLSEHSYRMGKYVVKTYPPGSFGMLHYCNSLGIPVENPVALGIDKTGSESAIIVDVIEGRDYEDIVSDDRFGFLGLSTTPGAEMRALGRTVYSFCHNGIAPGDSKLKNYMYDGSKAVRVDMIPDFVTFTGVEWKRIDSDIDNSELYEENRDRMSSLFCDLRSSVVDMAAVLTHKPQSRKRFRRNVKAFFEGFRNDGLSSL